MVPENARQFSIHLQRGSEPEAADIHLHLSTQLGGHSPALVLRNSKRGGVWGVSEQIGPIPALLAHRPFLLAITAYLDIYEVEVNGSSNFSLQVRDGLPISSVTHLAIEAELTVRAIHIPVETMPRQLRLSLGNGAKVGDMYFIRGQPTEDAKSFTINCQTGPAKFDDALLQMTNRLDEGRVVLNSRQDDEFGAEQICKELPMSPEKHFNLILGVAGLGFETRLNGKEWVKFEHRQDVETAKTLFLEGDMQPEDIRIDTVQVIPKSMLNGTNLKSRRVRLQLLCPEAPVSERITGGFEKDCVLIVSGKMKTQASSFEMAIQCGEGPEDDTALKYQVQFEADGSARKVSLNSLEDGTWGQEVVIKDENSLQAGSSFCFLMVRQEKEFVCFLNSVEHSRFSYRLEDLKPDHVALGGDVELHRLLIL